MQQKHKPSVHGPSPLAKVPGDSSLAERAYGSLRGAIQEGRIRPGDRLTETEVAGWLRMSRTPVREALRRLQAEGVMLHEPRGGLIVAKLDRQAVMELYTMREVLEGTAAKLCAQHSGDDELLELQELVRLEKELQGNYAALAHHNRRFHEAVYRGAHNRYLQETLHVVYDRIGLLGQNQMFLPDRANASLLEHAELVRTIEKRDLEGAEASARAHVQAAQRERLKLLFGES
jgi:DNA-binding GntR family transcriptional regulator